jgi:hypothetical protein
MKWHWILSFPLWDLEPNYRRWNKEPVGNGVTTLVAEGLQMNALSSDFCCHCLMDPHKSSVLDSCVICIAWFLEITQVLKSELINSTCESHKMKYTLQAEASFLTQEDPVHCRFLLYMLVLCDKSHSPNPTEKLVSVKWRRLTQREWKATPSPCSDTSQGDKYKIPIWETRTNFPQL